MDENMKEIFKEYLKESLSVCIVTEKYYGDYGSNEGVKVCVSIDLDGETITSSYDYTSL